MTKQIYLFIVFGAILSLVVMNNVYGKEDISVTCYRGNPADDRRVGEVSVFNVNSARGNCNALYYDCEGNCTPCYSDDDSRVVCIDPSGNPYYL